MTIFNLDELLQLMGYSFALETDGTETFLNLRSRTAYINVKQGPSRSFAISRLCKGHGKTETHYGQDALKRIRSIIAPDESILETYNNDKQIGSKDVQTCNKDNETYNKTYTKGAYEKGIH